MQQIRVIDYKDIVDFLTNRADVHMTTAKEKALEALIGDEFDESIKQLALSEKAIADEIDLIIKMVVELSRPVNLPEMDEVIVKKPL